MGRTHPAYAVARTALAAILVTSPGVAWAAGPAASKASQPDGKPVQVTKEMIGAGIVSSGATLPDIPPVTGSRERPVPSWGKPLPYPIVIADRSRSNCPRVTSS